MTAHKLYWLLAPVLVVLACLAGVVSETAHAQVEFSNVPPPGVPVFDLDWAAFRQGKDSLRIECYYRITNPRLSYIRRTAGSADSTRGSSQAGADTSRAPEVYAGAYEITAVLATEHDRQVATASLRENYTLPNFEETRNPSGYLVNILSLAAKPDDYDLDVTLTDRVSGTNYTLRRSLPLREVRGGKLAIGGPMFFDPTADPPHTDRFAKRGGYYLVPNIGRSFAGGGERLSMYLEYYPAAASGAADLLVEVDQRFGKKKLYDTIPIQPGDSTVPIVYKNPLTGFATGEATLELRLVGSDGKDLVDPTRVPFWVDWSTAGMIDENWEEAVDMLVHIANHAELKKLRETPHEQRAAAFAAFWKSKDPSPESEENEWQEEYYRRIRYADLHFTTAFMRGWRTDYGTVYVRYGEPDEIERYPFERGAKPYQIWYYYGQRRRFVFVDINGNGEYQLQYPYDGIVR